MRKYVIGMILGAALMFSAQAGAASLLGSKVTNVVEVTLDGKSLGNAPVIAGTSYLPVRTLSNNLNIGIEVKGETVNLTALETTTAPTPPPAPVRKFPYTMTEIDAAIQTIAGQIQLYQSQVDGFEKNGKADDPFAESLREAITKKQVELEVWQQRKTELEAQP